MNKKLSLHIDNLETSIVIGSGLLAGLDKYAGRKLIFLVDENVFRLHKSEFKNKDCIVIPSGESHKTLSYAEDVFRKLVEHEVDRSSFLVGVGGGLVTDLAGFVASTYMRGIAFGFVSTTLLGQVDASIGGKNGVNLDGFKNMIGIFRQPEFVWCDTSLLQSLEYNELLSGFSEVIKYGAIQDKLLFNYLEEHYNDILHLEMDSLEKVITESASIKVRIVESDVTEKGERRLLNFGHTLGHAVEKLTGMLHGEAVAIGMVLAARLSGKLGFLAGDAIIQLEQLIANTGLPHTLDIAKDELFSTLLKDKKRSGDKINVVLLKSIGDAFIHEMDLDELKNALYDLY